MLKDTFQVQATQICSVSGKEVMVYGSERLVFEIKILGAIISFSKIYANRNIWSRSFKCGECGKKKLKLNSVAFNPQANYTDRATAAFWRN
jgi:hypothetical protein